MIKQKIFFGRIKARKISEEKKKILDFHYNHFLFHPDKLVLSKSIFLEIGFGMGQNLLEIATHNKDSLVIGVDPFLNGIASLIENCVNNKINNVLVYPKPIQEFLEQFKNIYFEKVFILIPEPLPKKKHQKRRVFKDKFIQILLERIKKNGEIYFATDNQDYYEQALHDLEIVKKTTHISIQKVDSNELVLTKYFQRAKKLGNNVNFLVIVKL